MVGPDGRALGVLTIDDVRLVPPVDRAQRRAGDVACLDPALLVSPETPVTELLARPAFLRTGRVVVVDAARRPVGIVSITDIERRIRADALLNERSPNRTAA